MADMCSITEMDIKKLLELFAKQDYNPKVEDTQSEEVLNRCIELWKLDYDIEFIANEKGEFCDSYPARIPIPIAEAVEKSFNASAVDFGNLSFEHEGPLSTENGQKSTPKKRERNDRKNINSKVWKHNISKSNVARCWNRFPVPVLLINGKYISRSATISATIDVGLKSFVGKFTKKCQPNAEEETNKEVYESSTQSKAVHHIARLDDVKLLKMCEVSSIIDFMVEKKKQKYCLNVSSSEKVDVENRYKDFSIYSMPYPGCEFFKKFSQRNLNSEDLHPTWNDTAWESNEAKINVPEDLTKNWSADWDNYKSWDLRTLTDNYIRVILDLLMNKKEKGLLLHCISGWDRTPLFISLIRLILWGEGTIHRNLNSLQMLYFTLGYDWYLFKHKLNTRISNGEHILYFCFEVLGILSIDKIIVPRSRSVSVGSQGSSFEFLNLSNLHENSTNEEISAPHKPLEEYSTPPKALDDTMKVQESQSNEFWPFNISNGSHRSETKENAKNSDDLCTYRLSSRERIATSGRNVDFEDDEVAIVETSLSPGVRIPVVNSSPKSPFSGRQSAVGVLEVNDPLSCHMNVDNEAEVDFKMGVESIRMPSISSPLPVPGTECDNANDSFDFGNSGSWNYVTKDASVKGSSWEGFIKKKDGGIYEKSIGSSLGSASSFLAYDKSKRLKKVRLLFYKLFGEVAVLNKTS